jgi:plasmid stability protein
MASLTVRNIDESVKNRLRIRAAQHGRSMEDEVRHILKASLDHDPPKNLADLALEIFGPKHGIDEFPAIPPIEMGEPPQFDRVQFDRE